MRQDPVQVTPDAVGEDRSELDVVLDSVNAAIVTIDVEGTIIDSNQAASRLFGHAREAMRGRDVALLMPEEHAVRHDGYIRHHLETGESRIIGIGRQVRGRRADGTEFPLHLAIGKYTVDGRTRFTGIMHDRSDDERMALATTRLGRMLDQSATETYVFDGSTLELTLVSRGALANLGYTMEELRGTSFLDLCDPAARPAFEAQVARLHAGPLDRVDFASENRREDGSTYEVRIALNLSRAVRPPEFVALIDDVTERNRVMAAARDVQRMESIAQLSGGIAHDFNNLLTVISGNLELLDAMLDDDDETRRELVAEARHATSMGARLTQRLLAFARRGSLSPEALDLNALLVSLGPMLRRSLGENTDLDTVLLPSLWPIVVDRSELENAIVNLALNANDAMPRGGRLTLETANATLEPSRAQLLDLPAGDYASIEVLDSGVGMSPEHLGRLFEPFFTTKGDTRHRGLGLCMVYGFARQSGGAVAVRSTLGEGTGFTLYLPRADASEIPARRDDDEDQRSRDDALRVLVAEDEPAVRRLTVRRLRSMGHAVVAEVDAPGALARYRDDGPFDAVVTDMIMPGGMTGLDLAKAVRDTGDRRTRLVVVTGYADERLDAAQLDAFELRLVRKPYADAELRAALAEPFRDAGAALPGRSRGVDERRD